MASVRNIIRRREIVADDWRTPDEDSTGGETRALILPLARWHAERDRVVAVGRASRRAHRPCGSRRAAAAGSQAPVADCHRVHRTLGRARLQPGRAVLRDRLGFTGELRAVGYVKRDQLFFLARCGFDAFELSAGVDPQSVLTAFDDFDVSYQPATLSTREQRRFYAHSR